MNIAFLLELHKAVGAAITVEQQLWISGRYTTLTAFLASPEGKIAAQQFVDDWKACVEKPA